ncbi:MAG: UDP-N-acetylmuramate--L-alanine ligase [Simkaniaceae bacterium]|nr:UDP-N-acetylmuramate--L-alanine ligase [Simkaniaceae bacterium]
MDKVVLAVSGTGGHLFPAQALARELEDVLFLGPDLSTNRFFFHEFPSVNISAGKTPFKILRGVVQSLKVLRREKPRLVIGFGSYHSLPPLLAALLLRIPIALYEPNQVPGRVNRLLRPFDQLKNIPLKVPLFHHLKVPQEEALAYFGLKKGLPAILIFGGSQGAQRLKEVELPYQLIKLDKFEKNMHYAWSAADLVICRSGASSIAEHRHYEVPAIFIPYPYATDDHQTANARACKGAVTLPEAEIHRLPEVVEECLCRLTLMKKAIQDEEQKGLSMAKALYPHHFIGAKGIGMSALMQIVKERGYPVSGSDRGTHSRKNITPLMKVIYSTDIPSDNCEYRAARKQRLHRSLLLAELLKGKPLFVAGAHGKTTTSGLLAWTLIEAKKDPTYAIGGVLTNLNKNGGSGEGEYSVGEADESDGSFLKYTPYSAIITNVEKEHLNYWKTEEALLQGYRQFIARVQDKVIYSFDDPHLSKWTPRGISYGFSEGADEQILSFRQEGGRIIFSTTHYADIEVPLIGKHNAMNALAVFLLARSIGIEEEAIRRAFQSFKGMKRRLEYRGLFHGVERYDDYGHHPTEIETTLRAFKEEHAKKRVILVFQPHRYTRTRDCFPLFSRAFEGADEVILTDIYSAGEVPIPGVTIEALLQTCSPSTHYIPRDQLATQLPHLVKEGDVILTMGAGDITNIPSL